MDKIAKEKIRVKFKKETYKFHPKLSFLQLFRLKLNKIKRKEQQDKQVEVLNQQTQQTQQRHQTQQQQHNQLHLQLQRKIILMRSFN